MTGGDGWSLVDRLGARLGGGSGGRAGLRHCLSVGGLLGRRAGRKGGHYTLNEFGASRRQGSGWRWVWLGDRRSGRKGGLRSRRTGLKTGHYRERIGGRGRIEVVEVLVDPVADGIAPIIGAKGVNVFVLGELDGLEEGLGEIGEGSGGARFYIALEDGGEDATEGGAEIVGGQVVAGEAIGEFAGELLGKAGPGFFAGMVEAEVGMLGGAGSAAPAAVGKGEAACGHAVLIECGRRAANRAKRGHGWLQKVGMEMKKPR